MAEKCKKEKSSSEQSISGSSDATSLEEAFILRGKENGKEFRMVRSNRNKQCLVRDGYMYRLDHAGKKQVSWRCCLKGCSAHLKTNRAVDMIILDNDKAHTHSADSLKFEKQLLRMACKRKAGEDMSRQLQDIISEEMSHFSDINLNPENTKFLQLAMYRVRKKKSLDSEAKTNDLLAKHKSDFQKELLDGYDASADHFQPESVVEVYIEDLKDKEQQEETSNKTFQVHFAPASHEEEGSLILSLQEEQVVATPTLNHYHRLKHDQLTVVEGILPETIKLEDALDLGSSSATIKQPLSCLPVLNDLSYADLQKQHTLLQDKLRTLTFRRALLENRNQLKGAFVLVVEAGIGILGHFAVQAGASRVYATESSGLASCLERIAKDNGLESVITVIRSSVEDATLPIKVDAIICEWMGHNLLSRPLLPALLLARDKFLKQNGDMYPREVTLYLAPITDDTIHERLISWHNIKDSYGVCMTSLTPLTMETLAAETEICHLKMDAVLATPVQLCHYDLRTMDMTDAQLVKTDFHFLCNDQRMVHGFATWFSASFPGSIVLDTSPFSLKTSWGQAVMYLRQPLQVRLDSEIHGSIKIYPSSQNKSEWITKIKFQLNGGKAFVQKWKCKE